MNNQIRCISHEIRNQISICELYSQIIKKNLEKEKIKNDSIDNAIFCITKSLKIISNNLIDLKAIDNYSPEKYDLRSLLKNGADLSMVYIQDKDIEISLSVKKSVDVYVDENKFLACVVNIIKNAVESIDEKGLIEIFADVQSDIISIKFKNDGKPIPEEAQKHLFDEGYTTKNTGSGLGLPICAGNLALMGGKLNLLESNNKDTIFEIILPVYKA